MATHECNRCLSMTIRGASSVVEPLVLAVSECNAHGGGSHTWQPCIQPAGISTQIKLQAENTLSLI